VAHVSSLRSYEVCAVLHASRRAQKPARKGSHLPRISRDRYVLHSTIAPLYLRDFPIEASSAIQVRVKTSARIVEKGPIPP
jgi:hypothetical protein